MRKNAFSMWPMTTGERERYENVQHFNQKNQIEESKIVKTEWKQKQKQKTQIKNKLKPFPHCCSFQLGKKKEKKTLELGKNVFHENNLSN